MEVKSFQTPRIAFFGLFLLAIFSYFCSGNILRQGQEIKQFHAYGITRSLTKNHFDVLHTYIPCEDTRNHAYPRPWAEEPPLFHSFAAVLQTLGIEGPQWPGYVISLMTCFAAFYLVYFFYPGSLSRFFLLLIPLTTPVFLRYFSEHLPEGLSVLFFFLSVIFYLRNSFFWILFFLTLAVTAKAFAVFPAMTFLLWVFFFSEPPRSLQEGAAAVIKYGASLGVVVLPFLIWLALLAFYRIPNPFDFSMPFENRHSGAWRVLFSWEYWDRFFTFMGTKGVGWPLFIAYGFVLVHGIKRRFKMDRFHGAFYFWALGFLPFWLFVRAASIIHDHYVLQYFYPMAFLGTEKILKLPYKKTKAAILTVTCAMGLVNPVIWRWRVRGNLPAPSHCGQEVHSLRRFPLRALEPEGPAPKVPM